MTAAPTPAAVVEQLTARFVVLDIEGTTSAAEAIVGGLYRYAGPRLGPWIEAHRDDPETAAAVRQVEQAAALPQGAPIAAVAAALHAWMADDVKATPLKTLQGRIWADGFERGELTAHFFRDVIPALRAWTAAGVRLAVFSSGSVAAQRSWFAHSPDGDLTPLIDGFFDTATAGPKKLAASYRTIAAALGAAGDRLLFLSDHPDEITAAAEAGWLTAAVRRAGEPHAAAGFADRRVVSGFDRLEVSPP
ncbi:MAG TPA: acireductone synthase [Actinocrinis sp.]|jgi:enolase-phosphatase E1